MPPIHVVLVRIGLLSSLLWGALLLDLRSVMADPAWDNVSVQNVVRQTAESPASVLDRLAMAQVVYLGETHDRAADHVAQQAIVQALHARRPQLIIAMEMFQRPAQPALNAYLAGNLTETELQTRSEYQTRWGFPWEFYAPVLRFAQAHQLPVIALNTPSEVTRKMARQGLASLTWAERRWIPPLGAIALGPDAYRQRLQAIYASFHSGKTSSQNFDRFFQAQVLWDETMAERIAETAKRSPHALIVVLVGQGHLLYGDGIPDRVRRRRPQIQQVTLLLNPDAATSPSEKRAIADYIWMTSQNNSPDRF
jgi:uncharacterized iron-regulated protein